MLMACLGKVMDPESCSTDVFIFHFDLKTFTSSIEFHRHTVWGKKTVLTTGTETFIPGLYFLSLSEFHISQVSSLIWNSVSGSHKMASMRIAGGWWRNGGMGIGGWVGGLEWTRVEGYDDSTLLSGIAPLKECPGSKALFSHF